MEQELAWSVVIMLASVVAKISVPFGFALIILNLFTGGTTKHKKNEN